MKESEINEYFLIIIINFRLESLIIKPKINQKTLNMRQLFELIPIILFFITYKMSGETISIMGYTHTLDGIFSATAVLMIASTIQMALTLAIDGKIKTSHLWLYALVIVAGSATIYLRDHAFIKWKPTVFNWGMAIVLYGSLFLSKKYFRKNAWRSTQSSSDSMEKIKSIMDW